MTPAMATLRVAVGQHSDKGRKDTNQDFHGVCIPREPQLGSKGIAVALADGISSSAVGHVASESAVHGFLEDYYCTSDAWSVKASARSVVTATNSWLYAQTQRSIHRYDKDRGYVCTFSALVLKSTTAHLFHVGDSRIYRLRGGELEQLTIDHRAVVAEDRSYLARALGVDPHVDIDYLALPLEAGDVFVLATDGVYEYVAPHFVMEAVAEHAADLDLAARAIVDEAYRRESPDNLTVQLIRIDGLPPQQAGELQQRVTELPLPPILSPREVFDGYRILREIHGSSRSHIYLAEDTDSGATVVVKIPSIELRGDPAYLERFMLEEWVARRIDSAHVLKPCARTRRQDYLYVVMEYVEGQTLSQWMIDHPRPSLETVRGIVEQITRGLRAFHRREILHQDLRPDNIMIDRSGTVKIIDFGSARVAGMTDSATPVEREFTLGTPQYTAPEYFLGEAGSTRSDQFSLGVIAYQMLTGRLPYGAEVAKARNRAAQNRLRYRSALDDDRDIPAWVDDALHKAVHVNPAKRYEALSEFMEDLRRPHAGFAKRARPALIERNPVRFWQGLALLQGVLLVVVLWLLLGR